MKGVNLAKTLLFFLIAVTFSLPSLSMRGKEDHSACTYFQAKHACLAAERERSFPNTVLGLKFLELFNSTAFAQQGPPVNAGLDVYNRQVDREMRRNMEVQNRTQTDVERAWAGGYFGQPWQPFPYPPSSPWSPFTFYPPSPCCPQNGR